MKTSNSFEAVRSYQYLGTRARDYALLVYDGEWCRSKETVERIHPINILFHLLEIVSDIDFQQDACQLRVIPNLRKELHLSQIAEKPEI